MPDLPKHQHSGECECYQNRPPAPPWGYWPPPVQQPSGGAGKWLAIGMGGSALLLTVAVTAVAVAIAAVSLALAALVIYWIIRDIRKH